MASAYQSSSAWGNEARTGCRNRSSQSSSRRIRNDLLNLQSTVNNCVSDLTNVQIVTNNVASGVNNLNTNVSVNRRSGERQAVAQRLLGGEQHQDQLLERDGQLQRRHDEPERSNLNANAQTLAAGSAVTLTLTA
jgi:translation elongation factor EF-1beta